MVLRDLEEQYSGKRRSDHRLTSGWDEEGNGVKQGDEALSSDTPFASIQSPKNSSDGVGFGQLASSIMNMKLSEKEKGVVANVNKTFLLRYMLSACAGFGAGVWVVRSRQFSGFKAFAVISSAGLLGELVGRRIGTQAAISVLNRDLPPDSQLRELLSTKNVLSQMRPTGNVSSDTVAEIATYSKDSNQQNGNHFGSRISRYGDGENISDGPLAYGAESDESSAPTERNGGYDDPRHASLRAEDRVDALKANDEECSEDFGYKSWDKVRQQNKSSSSWDRIRQQNQQPQQ